MSEPWINSWLDGVTGGKSTMSQRVMSSIEANGGLDAVVSAAKQRGVHLLKVTDDTGRVLVAASLEPFEVLC